VVVLVVVFDGVQSLDWGHAVATLLVVDFSGGSSGSCPWYAPGRFRPHALQNSEKLKRERAGFSMHPDNLACRGSPTMRERGGGEDCRGLPTN